VRWDFLPKEPLLGRPEDFLTSSAAGDILQPQIGQEIHRPDPFFAPPRKKENPDLFEYEEEHDDKTRYGVPLQG
jgi:hypothetical protein